MSNEINNPPAFPAIWNIAHNSDWQTDGGMSLRDWFAGQALAGFLADGSQRHLDSAHREEPDFLDLGPSARAAVINRQLAIGCFALADAMLEARATQDPPHD